MPYRIVYEISEDKVIVHTIIDGRRNFEDIIISKLSRYYGNNTAPHLTSLWHRSFVHESRKRITL